MRKNLILASSVLLTSIFFCEIMFRVVSGVSPFVLINFRETRPIRVQLHEVLRYDSQLGWVTKENLAYDGYRTTQNGFRRHVPDQTEVRKSAILVSGSSFAAGSEVKDPETWPAQLEEILGRPVENAAVGGFGADQVVMRAEQLLPISEPETILVEVMDTSIQWVCYSDLGYPKPYYTIVGGKLVENNIPVPRVLRTSTPPRIGWLKSITSYSLIVDLVKSKIDADAWYGQPETVVRIQCNSVGVTCALLQRLKHEIEERQARAVLVTAIAASDVMASDKAPQTTFRVEECSRKMGYQIVSVFDRMRELYRENPKNLEAMYYRHGANFGHNTPLGNREVALLVADALNAAPNRGKAADYHMAAFMPGQGINLLQQSERFDELTASLAAVHLDKLAKPAPSEAQQFRISVSKPKGEHYLVMRRIRVGRGPLTLSFDARPEGSDALRVQMLTSTTTGVIADFDLRKKRSNAGTLGDISVDDALVSPLPEGWYRISVGATFPATDLTVILQLRNVDGSTNFVPENKAVVVRAVQLERGQSASPYRFTSDLPK